MAQNLTIGALLAGSYLLGALPFGLWIALKWCRIDIRTVGSSNIGATNVWRVCGPKAGSVTFAFDVAKGLVPPLVGGWLHLPSQWQILAALLAIVGHTYSILLGFKGGKGIATGLGALLGIAPKVGIAAFGLFGLVVVTFHYVSLGSILGAASLPVFMALLYPGDGYRLAFALAAAFLGVYKHRANLKRLRAGTEPKIRPLGSKSNKPGPDATTRPIT